MCASKTGDAKQKEILQKLKNKETPKQKASFAKSDSSGSQKLSVSSALKPPLSQVLRKSIEAGATRHHQEPVKECTCAGDTYEANLGEEDEGLVGCSNPVVTVRLVRPSVKIPFRIMCEMHLWRLKHHHSCPYCGLFCSQCVIDKNGDTYLSLSLNMLLKKIAGKYQHKAEKILLKDISRGKEQVSIQCVNEVDDEPPPLDFLYVTENCETTPTNIDRTITSLQKSMLQRYLGENGVWGAFGCHPKNANVYSDLIDSDLRSALDHPKVRALGEIGLDYSRGLSR